ncbi:O-acyltransferase like protein-like [Littorina saxatilis]|uniref:O-acyltransferase like protein-like n=1 Tax=Littorina saxatilis TaxID=31220 RepID=UPI0038B4C022
MTCLNNMETSTSRLVGTFTDLVAKVVERWRRSRLRSKVSSQCQRDLGNFVEGLLNLEEWAVQMADSYGRPGPGLTRGQKTFVGDYGQCRDTGHTLSTGRSLRGQFCTLTTKTHLMSHAPQLARMFYLLDTVDVHVCVPNSCSDDDVIAVFSDIIASFGGELMGAACVRGKNPSADPFYRLAVFVLSVLLLSCLAGTVLDLVSEVNSKTCGSDTRAIALDKEDDVNNNPTTGQVPNKDEIRSFKEKLARVLLCFSLPQNMREIFSTSHADARDDVPCIHGVRVLSTLWLAILHSWTQYRHYGNLLGNPEDVHKLYKVWWFFTFFCLPFGVDTFLILSGFLAVSSFLRHFQRKNGVGSTKILLTYLSHRLWRLGPPLAMMLLVFYGVVPYLCIGPFDLSSEDQDTCRPRIWTTLFFVNNIFLNMSDYRPTKRDDMPRTCKQVRPRTDLLTGHSRLVSEKMYNNRVLLGTPTVEEGYF